MKRRNRQVYRELEARSRLLDEMTRYVEPLIERLEAAELKLRVITGENQKLQGAYRRLTSAFAYALLELEELRSQRNDLAVLVDEYENHEGSIFDNWGIDIGGEG